MKHPKIPQTEVLEWLADNHPKLHADAEIDRDWVWVSTDLRGEANKPTRESIKEYGFRFHTKGGHLLPSGKLGMWGHSCERPTRFKPGGKGRQDQGPGKPQQAAPSPHEMGDDALLAMLESLE